MSRIFYCSKIFFGGEMILKRSLKSKIKIEDLGELELVVAGNHDSDSFKIWKRMMQKYHPLGFNRLFGKRIMYLIKSSEYGYIGGLSFSASARRLESRDAWIGWDEIDRKDNLDNVINNSRFLIIPDYSIPNLGSYIFSKCFNTLLDDWFEKYQNRPLLVESFVDTKNFDGALYKASNWELIGQTKGRGRNDRNNEKKLSIKDIYVYPLHKKCKEKLCPTTASRRVVFTPFDWIESEFENVDLNDLRLKNRLLKMVRDFYAKPDSSIPELNDGNWGQVKATYRFFDNDKVTMEKILIPHYQKTRERISEKKIVLAVQDTTTLNYNNLKKTKGLGPIDSIKNGARGFLMHDTIVFDTSGVPLGLLHIHIWARDKTKFGKSKDRNKTPIEDKESYKWIRSFKAVESAKESCPNTQIISVCDREADVYELFELASESSAELLVRASHNRKLYKEQKKLWEKLENTKECGTFELSIPANDEQKKRTAKMSLCFSEVTLNPPKSGKKPIGVYAVYAKEIDAPKGIDGVEWMLLTTIKIDNFTEARKIVGYYAKRWGIEVYHKILKTSCKIEKKGLGTDKRLLAIIAIELIIGYKIYSLTKLSHEHSNISCKEILDEYEWKALNFFFKKKLRKQLPP